MYVVIISNSVQHVFKPRAKKICDTWLHMSARLNSILVQGYKSLSLIEDCSKTYGATYDEISTDDFLGRITFRAKILKISVRQIITYL